MTSIDKTKPILVTGATGYVAGWIIEKLLSEGLTVHAAVRNPNDLSKLEHLQKLANHSKGSIHFYKSDLMVKGSYHDAMQGCELVFHTASPFTSKYKDAQKELIDPAVKGTENVLNEATNTPSVKRVMLTSSCAAIYTDCIDTMNAPNGEITEAIWNTTSSLQHQPYSYSKTLAEKKAWAIQQSQNKWDLVVMNPSMVMGPSLNAKYTTSESFHLLKQMSDGTLKSGVPNVGIGVVDVRDLAQAHFNGAFNTSASGRNIISGHNTNFLELAQILHKDFGAKYKIPNSAMPRWLLMLVGPMVNKAVTREFVRNNVNMSFRANNAKSIKELQMNYRPLKQTMIDAFQSLSQNNLISVK